MNIIHLVAVGIAAIITATTAVAAPSGDATKLAQELSKHRLYFVLLSPQKKEVARAKAPPYLVVKNGTLHVGPADVTFSRQAIVTHVGLEVSGEIKAVSTIEIDGGPGVSQGQTISVRMQFQGAR